MPNHELTPLPAALTPGILAMRMVCPGGKGNPGETQTLGEVLASDHRDKVLPIVLENLKKADFLIQRGVFSAGQEDEAIKMTFGGAVVTDESGGIVREPHEATAYDRAEPGLQEAEKK